MRPGQTTINELEAAVLRRIASDVPAIEPLIDRLHVLSRKFTGVGCYTDFAPLDSPVSELGDRQIGLAGTIALSHVPSGLGASLACTDGSPAFIEFYTFGDELWDGTYEGFSIKDGA